MQTLVSKRLVLRLFTSKDTEAVLIYANDPEWARYLVNIPQPFTRADAEAFITRFSDTSKWDDSPMFAITVNGSAIGEVYLNVDLQNERAELGYEIARPYWGQGMAAKAAEVVMDWAFSNLNLNRVYATCDLRNARSQRVLEKLGMQREGLLRQHIKWNGEYRDHVYYGILKEEWQEGRNNE